MDKERNYGNPVTGSRSAKAQEVNVGVDCFGSNKDPQHIINKAGIKISLICIYVII